MVERREQGGDEIREVPHRPLAGFGVLLLEGNHGRMSGQSSMIKLTLLKGHLKRLKRGKS